MSYLFLPFKNLENRDYNSMYIGGEERGRGRKTEGEGRSNVSMYST